MPHSVAVPYRTQDVATTVEDADRETAQDAARHRRHPVVKALGSASEIADQIPLSVLCATVVAGGVIAGRSNLARVGARMMTAHILANSLKRVIKNNVKRTRPQVMIDERIYECRVAKTEGGYDTSFPSGHTAGAMAVAAVVAHDLPRVALPAWAIAALVSGIQVPRGKHYPIDVAAGAVLGLAAAGAVEALWPRDRQNSASKPE